MEGSSVPGRLVRGYPVLSVFSFQEQFFHGMKLAITLERLRQDSVSRLRFGVIRAAERACTFRDTEANPCIRISHAGPPTKDVSSFVPICSSLSLAPGLVAPWPCATAIPGHIEFEFTKYK